MRNLLLAVLLLLMCSPSIAHAAEPKITAKQRVLAQLLQGNWIKNDYYTQHDLVYVRGIRFGCSGVISDCPFSDALGDTNKLQVTRTYFNFSGGVAHVDTVVLTPQQYWGLVREAEARLEKKPWVPMVIAEPVEMLAEQKQR